MATRMQQRRGTASQWTAANPVLAAGEIGFETDTNKFKMGNGSSAWTALAYFSNTTALEALLNDGAPGALNTLNELAAAIGDDPAFFTTVATNLTAHQTDTIDVHGISDTSLLVSSTQLSNHEADTTGVHGIADTSLLATTANTTAAITAHESDTTSIHGIADTSLLATTGDITTHNNDTTSVHGIADTAELTTQTQLTTAITAEAVVTAAALSAHQSDTTSIHGISDTSNLVYQSNLTDHSTDTTSIHGIADTSLLATTGDITTHNNDTTSVHGIADTAQLATLTDVTDAVTGATVNQAGLAGVGIDFNTVTVAFDIDSTVATKTYADNAVSTHQDDTTNVHGIADTSLLATTADVAAVTKSSLGLANVDNTTDANKPVSTAQATAIAAAQAAAISDATSQVNALITGAPAAMNTLDELAAALGDDENFAASVTASLGLKVDSVTPISQKTASYTLSLLSERDDLIEMGSSSAMTLTIPTNATVAWPVGTSIDILQTGTGQVTVAGAGGVTVNATPGLKLRTQYSSATVFKRAENTWVVFGDLTA